MIRPLRTPSSLKEMAGEMFGEYPDIVDFYAKAELLLFDRPELLSPLRQELIDFNALLGKCGPAIRDYEREIVENVRSKFRSSLNECRTRASQMKVQRNEKMSKVLDSDALKELESNFP